MSENCNFSNLMKENAERIVLKKKGLDIKGVIFDHEHRDFLSGKYAGYRITDDYYSEKEDAIRINVKHYIVNN